MGLHTYSPLFSTLDEALHTFIQAVDAHTLNDIATSHWSVKDVLCHIVFWHTYYAQNYAALAQGKKPIVFTSKGGSTRNQEGVNSLKARSKKELIRLLHEAQHQLRESIVVKNIPEMNYTDRKKYKTEEFLDEIIRHIKGHTKQILLASQAQKL